MIEEELFTAVIEDSRSEFCSFFDLLVFLDPFILASLINAVFLSIYTL
ncbi:hypothetical protein BFJ63_vAg18089 [Fusarium oxysporum f. sp. narcissi]|uniref:Uncharacterized protein n=1 Tax=Fusarium oxysporum f. sp. narcissi TaxID=451672 RepID=A0A4Q2UY86_FUSOX|nr:hypothetical protein BFJ63_vAg18089 [Fusarium oxysporum f. sp. narcissi]